MAALGGGEAGGVESPGCTRPEGRAPAPAVDLVGVLNVRKERGWTSHDVVARLRRLSGQRRIGHAGTLDPLAEGVLPVLFGRATRLADVVGAGRKRYLAEVTLGACTTTDDAEGEVVERVAVPPLDHASLEVALEGFRGALAQVPPQYSAVKVAGQRAYAVARKGGATDLAARTVTVYALTLVSFDLPRLTLDVTCSRGTYIRSLARDLAQALGTRGHLSALTRTEVGSLGIEDALTLADIQRRGVAAALLAVDAALPHLPHATVSDVEIADLLLGRPVLSLIPPANLVRVYDPAHTLRLIAISDGRSLRPRIQL